MGDEKVEIINDLDTQKVITITIPDTSQSLTIGNNFLDESLITKLGVLVMDNAHLFIGVPEYKRYSLLPKDFFLVNDYVYYPEKEEFERAGRLALVLPGTGDKTIKKFSIKQFMESPHFNSEITPFDKFVSMHVIIGASDLMPTIMTVYKDETYDLDTFHADIKTTVYRKVNETAEQILQGNVKEVYFMTTYVVVEYQDNLLNLTSKERLMKGSDEYLAFMKVDCDLNETEYAFDGENITQMEYVVKQMRYCLIRADTSVAQSEAEENAMALDI